MADDSIYEPGVEEPDDENKCWALIAWPGRDAYAAYSGRDVIRNCYRKLRFNRLTCWQHAHLEPVAQRLKVRLRQRYTL